jgi:starch synthase (maltosyl-transferring)
MAPPRTKRPPARIQIQDVTPQVDCGRYHVKRTVGERVDVRARIFRDGHETLGAAVRWRPRGATKWADSPLQPVGNDWWEGSFAVDAAGVWSFRIEAWVDRVATWQVEVRRKSDAGQADLTSELAEGALLLGRDSVTLEAGLAVPAGWLASWRRRGRMDHAHTIRAGWFSLCHGGLCLFAA